MQWRSNLVDDDAGLAALLRSVRRVAVLGIKTEAQDGQPAFYVPQYLARAGILVVQDRCLMVEHRRLVA